MFPFVQSHDNLTQRRHLQKQRLRHRLQLQSHLIERVMDAHQLPAQVSGGSVDQEVIHFDLQTQLNSGLDRIRALTADLRLALSVPQISIIRENGRFQIAVARPVEAPVGLLDVLSLGLEIPLETAVIGLSEGGAPVLLPIYQNHVLISGIDGAGKTSLLRTIAVSLALANRQSQLQQVIIAPVFENNDSFSVLEPLTVLPHMTAQVAYRLEDAAQHLAWLVEEMEHRRRWGDKVPSIVVLIDQVSALMEMGNDSIVEAITVLLQRGKEAGIHLILTTSKPDSDRLDTYLKANLPIRVVGHAADAAQATAASGLDNSDAEYLLGRGDFMLVQNNQFTYFQAAFINDYDLHLSLKKLHENFTYSILARPFTIRKELTNSNLEPIPATFWMRDGNTQISS